MKFSVFLMAILVSGLVFMGIANFDIVHAESSITKPAIPEFTVQIVAYPYDVPTTYSIDPYTGQEITHQGYHVENKSIQVRIKNQPFTPYWIIDSDSGTNMSVVLHYNVWVKGRFSENWNNVYSLSDGLPTQSSGEYTIFSLPINYPSGSQVDFKVAAMAGYVHRPIDPASGWPIWRFTGEESWSNIQTITIGANSVEVPEQSQVNPNETSVPNQQLDAQSGIGWIEIGLFAALGVIATLLIVVIALVRKKSSSKSDVKN